MVTEPPSDLAEACALVAADPRRALAVIDVDEVLALFVQGFDRHLRERGHELRMTSFSLFDSLYPLGRPDPAPKETGRALLEDFFASGCVGLAPAPHAAEVLDRLSQRAQVVILSAAPPSARSGRAAWLRANGLAYPLVMSGGEKGPEIAALAAAARGPAAFVDDILRNLDSAMEAAPHVSRFQLIADPELRRLAPSKPEHHARVEDWLGLEPRLNEALFGEAPHCPSPRRTP